MNGIIGVAAVLFSFQCHLTSDFPYISCQFIDGAECTPPPEITQDSYTELTELLFGCCVNEQATKAAFAYELSQLVTEPEQVKVLLEDLKKGDESVFSALLSFVNVPPHLFSRQYLTDELTDFERSNIKQIVGELRKLRQVFKLFPEFANTINLAETPPDSSNSPISSFAYKVKKGVKEIQESMTNLPNQESEILPFFSNHDVARAKFLKNVVEYGHKNRMIHQTRSVKVFQALCQLTEDNVVEAGYDSEGELRDLCIIPDPMKPTQQKCEVLDETKNMAKAFLELREKIKEQLEC
jgi:hypothetical protein